MARKQRSQSLPYIYGYKKLRDSIAINLKRVVKKREDYILDIAINYNRYITETTLSLGITPKESELFKNVRSERKRIIAAIMYSALLPWFNPIRSEFYDITLQSYREGYTVGWRDSRIKLQEALAIYRTKKESKYRKEIAALLIALRREEERVPISYRLTQDHKATEATNGYGDAATKAMALIIANEIIKTSISEEEKKENIEKNIKKYLLIGGAIIITTKLITSESIADATSIYRGYRKPRPVAWAVDNPQDTPCIMSAGEIVIYGQPFSNGFIEPLVHKYCHCALYEVDIDDGYVKYLIDIYL